MSLKALVQRNDETAGMVFSAAFGPDGATAHLTPSAAMIDKVLWRVTVAALSHHLRTVLRVVLANRRVITDIC